MPQPRRAKKPVEPTPAQNPPVEADLTVISETLPGISRQTSGRGLASPEEVQALLDDIVLMADSIPLMRDPMGYTPNPALERAQDLMYEAVDTGNQRKRIAMAKRALKISPDCTDAWVLLAQDTAKSPEEERDLYRKGVRAGERALGEAAFANDAGMFWVILETRPYMRARHGLAMALWEMGEREEAIGHYRAMLELNPDDNQGIRYLLVTSLLEMGDDAEAGKLLGRYDEDESAAWGYSRALWRFRTEGDGRRANAALRKAISQNPFIPQYLLGQKPIPADLPAFMGFGDESEAQAYVVNGLSTWLQTDGAIDWLCGLVAKASPP